MDESRMYGTGCLRNYRKSILLLRLSVLGRLRDFQYMFALIHGTLSIQKYILLMLVLFTV